MKKKVLFGAVALLGSVFADGEIAGADKAMNGQNNHQTMDGQNNKQMKPGMISLMSARPESDNGWYLFADALYWHADVGSADWAVAVPDNSLSQRVFKAHPLNFKWSWGFKVGIGANINHDMWDTNLYYTWFHTHNSNAAGASSTGIVIDALADSEQFNSGRLTWNIHYSMFDWELGRWNYVSKNLALRPHVGLKGGWINQNIKGRFTGGAIAGTVGHDRFKNDFWGVGPSAGVNSLWVLGNAGARLEHRFSLFGDVAGALMYGHFQVKNKAQSTSLFGTAGYRARGLTRNLATTMLQGIMGLSWDTGFNKERNHFMLRVGYELQYWFRQNQLVKFASSSSAASSRLSDDLALQGLTADFRFAF